MPATATVIYPTGEDFDMDYYLKTHMPLVQKHWGSLGLQSWEVTQLDPASGYQVQALLFWKDLESFQAAGAHESAKTVFGDIPNFTKAKPLIVAGKQVAKS